MTKAVCCLILALGVTACVPPKAELVDDPSAPAARKPANKPAVAGPQEPANPAPADRPQSGMRLPQDRFIKQLPDRNDMTATTPAPTGGGVTATPPTADKREDE